MPQRDRIDALELQMLAVLSMETGGTGAASQVLRFDEGCVIVAPDPNDRELMCRKDLRNGDAVFDVWTGACIERAALVLVARHGQWWRSEALSQSTRVVLAKAERLTRDQVWELDRWKVDATAGLSEILGHTFPNSGFVSAGQGPFDQLAI